ncbi:MAG: YihY/virulence factor BrkB family protein [Ginsengibacter sp.]
MKFSFKGLWDVLKSAFGGFSTNRILKLSAALAYYTVFSVGPLLIVVVYLCSFFFGREAIEGTIYGQIAGFVGHDAALQLQEIIKSATIANKGNIAIIIGVITLLIGATSMFAEMQDSINMIWGLKPKPKSAFMIFLKTRLLSFGVIGSLGFLLLVSLSISGLIEALSNRLRTHFPQITVVALYIINLVITFGIISFLFAVIFRVLPDAKIKWKDVLSGAIATAVLFMIGKFGISFYISKAKIGSTYGAAGSLVVLLVWIYYSSVILYFGAEFTKAFAIKFGAPIQPNDYAVVTKTIEIDGGKKSLQQADRETKKDKQD